MSNSIPYLYLTILSNLVNIVNTIVKKEAISISSSDASSAQASYSVFINAGKNIIVPPNIPRPNFQTLESMVNQVALTKIAILNTDPRVLFIKNFIILNNIIPEDLRLTNDQLDFYFPVLGPFN
jgi:hypothetical protein